MTATQTGGTAPEFDPDAGLWASTILNREAFYLGLLFPGICLSLFPCSPSLAQKCHVLYRRGYTVLTGEYGAAFPVDVSCGAPPGDEPIGTSFFRGEQCAAFQWVESEVDCRGLCGCSTGTAGEFTFDPPSGPPGCAAPWFPYYSVWDCDGEPDETQDGRKWGTVTQGTCVFGRPPGQTVNRWVQSPTGLCKAVFWKRGEGAACDESIPPTPPAKPTYIPPCCGRYMLVTCCDGEPLTPLYSLYLDTQSFDLSDLDGLASPIVPVSIVASEGSPTIDCPILAMLNRQTRSDTLPSNSYAVEPIPIDDTVQGYATCTAALAAMTPTLGSTHAVRSCDGTVKCGGRNCPDGCFEPDELTIAIVGVGFEFCASIPGATIGTGASVNYSGPLHGSVTIIRNVSGDYVVSEYHIYINRAIYAAGDETCSGTPTSVETDLEISYTGGSDPNPVAAFGYNVDDEPELTLNLYVGDGGVNIDHRIGKFNLARQLCLRGPGPNIPITALDYGDGTGTAIAIGCPDDE